MYIISAFSVQQKKSREIKSLYIWMMAKDGADCCPWPWQVCPLVLTVLRSLGGETQRGQLLWAWQSLLLWPTAIPISSWPSDCQDSQTDTRHVPPSRLCPNDGQTEWRYIITDLKFILLKVNRFCSWFYKVHSSEMHGTSTENHAAAHRPFAQKHVGHWRFFSGVEAPSPENLSTVFEFILKGFDALGMKDTKITGSNRAVVCCGDVWPKLSHV